MVIDALESSLEGTGTAEIAIFLAGLVLLTGYTVVNPYFSILLLLWAVAWWAMFTGDSKTHEAE